MFIKDRTAATAQGPVQGVAAGNPDYTIFKGIPFAAPPVGDLRWQRPQGPKARADVLFCGAFRPAALQLHGKYEGMSMYDREFYPVSVDESEDCLYLNIWTPDIAPKTPAPVMVWIHGGGFNHGYSYEMEFDGEAYCRRGVILVTVPYRLGAMGFFAHPELDSTGNYAVWDVIAALKWIQENIRNFGGDSKNVTIFGQSAGGMMVNVLCASSAAKGLFAKAIIQSAPVLDGMCPTLGEVRQSCAKILDNLGLTLAEARNMPGEKISALMLDAAETLFGGSMAVFTPAVDGVLLSADPWETLLNGRYQDVPIVTGTVEGDALLFAPTADAGNVNDIPILWAQKHLEAGCKSPVYVYYFDRRMPGDDNGAFHSSELWYVFGTLPRCWRVLEDGFVPGDYALMDTMLTYWTGFAKSGAPGKKPIEWPAWRPDRPSRLHLNEHVTELI